MSKWIVWTSTLVRTVETASRLGRPIQRWKILDEIHAGMCDGLTYAEIKSQFPDVAEGRSVDKLRYRYPQGESYEDVSAESAHHSCARTSFITGIGSRIQLFYESSTDISWITIKRLSQDSRFHCM